MSDKINKNTTLKEVLESPFSEEILTKHNVPCVTCPMAKFEMEKLTLNHICQMYNIDCPKLIKELSKQVK